MTTYTNPQHRHDFVLLFDVTDGNPNGDPDGGNMPRTDPETLQGIVTDVCLKRKVRNYISTYEAHQATEEQKSRLKIFVEHHGVLNNQIQRAYTDLGLATVKPAKELIKDATILEGLRQLQSDVPDAFSAFTFIDSDDESADVVASLAYNGLLSDAELKEQVFGLLEGESSFTKNVKAFITTLTKKAGKPDKSRANAAKAQTWMCENFYDVRMFGAVMSTGLNAGQVRGSMQITFARSLDPVLPQDLAITRMAVTDEKDREKMQTIGRKTFIPYGLYMAHGFFSPYLAESTGVTEFDLKLFWEALVNMWDLDRSASRGMMAPRGLYVFSHENKLGNAPAHKLFERIKPELEEAGSVPRKFSDYTITVDEVDLPSGITLTRLIEG
jgi:CRISPR-associated protein Csd2